MICFCLRSTVVLFTVALGISTPIGAQAVRADLRSAIDWSGRSFTATIDFDIASAKLKMPTGRGQAEAETDLAFPRLARSILYRIPVDSSSDLGALIEQGTLAASEVERAIDAAERSPAVLTADLLTLSKTYTIALEELARPLIKHRRALEPPRVMQPRPTKAYTGIVIYADEELPVHGTRGTARAAACLFPKIWDSEMGLVFERNMLDPEIARARGVVRYAGAGDPATHEDLVGREPLRILARGLFGERPTDPIIDRDDALKLLSSEENRRLIREGRILIILGDQSLRALP